jgi:low temperature requirement protein LtrA
MTDADETGDAARGKRVGWVELDLDLVLVFAVGQVAHGVVADPQWARVAAALGLFATLWWTWTGFAVLDNRRDDDSRAADRLFVLAGTIPAGSPRRRHTTSSKGTRPSSRRPWPGSA